MKQKYIDAVANRNLIKVRIMLADELLLDPRGETFSEMLLYAKENLHDLFEPNNEANYEISPDRNNWDMDLASTIKQDLITNFSVEKLALFQEVAMEVGKDKAKALAEEDKREQVRSTHTSNNGRTSNGGGFVPASHRESSRQKDSETNRTRQKHVTDKRTMGTISLCGGAALSIIGICVEGCVAKTLLCLAGGAAVVVGGIVLLSQNKKK